jgi:predicted neuraminidase
MSELLAAGKKTRTGVGLVALVFIACFVAGKPVEAQDTTVPRILSKNVVYLHPSSDPYDCNDHYGFNHAPSIVLLPDGRLLVAWFSGPFEASVNQVILGSYSSDQGATWGPASVLQDFPRKSDFDPAFIADGVRTLFFFSAGRENRYPPIHDEKHQVGVASFKTYCRISEDSGKTWSDARAIGDKVYCRSNGIRLLSDELLLPIYEVPLVAGVLKSTDNGVTWKRYGVITTPNGAGEPSLTQLKSGDILMVLRTGDGFLWETISRDKGKTWSAPLRTNIAAAETSHNVFRLSDGRLLLTLNETSRKVRTPLNMRVSTDDGKTWGEPLKLTEVAIPHDGDSDWDREVTYPSVAELKDGTVIVVWARLIISDTEQYGDIESARVQVH